LVPLAKNQIAGDHHAASLVPLGEKGEQHLHLVAALLDIPYVVEGDRVVPVEDRKLVLEAQIALGSEQALDERVRRHEQDAVPTLDQLVADGADQVRLAAARQPEREQIVTPREERALAQRRQQLGDLRGQARPSQGRERLVRG